MKKRRIRIHKQTLKMMNNPEYIYIWVNPEDLVVAICSCDGSNKDAVKVKDKRECEIYSTTLFEELKRTNMGAGLSENCTYRFAGSVNKGNKVATFRIDNINC
ncbi:hypothetical protein SAMN02910456_02504 [Ruminococcaceae bacterium YRB3002]|nr:hypothetical protein SAMN02910456_02504 [Ruminococcaceae bacterium YRB3002]